MSQTAMFARQWKSDIQSEEHWMKLLPSERAESDFFRQIPSRVFTFYMF